MEFNDEKILSPAQYERIADEFNKINKTSFKIIKINLDKKEKNNLINNLNNISNQLNCTFNYLFKYKKSQKNNINKIMEYFDELKNNLSCFVQITDNEMEYNNYCNALNNAITLSTKLVRTLTQLCEFCDEAENIKIDNSHGCLLDIIDTLSQMFGQCKFRQ